MAFFVVVQMSIHDRERYQTYTKDFMKILIQYSGRLLAAQEGPEVVEGSWPYEKVVLLAFGDRESYERWAHSPEYQKIAVDRLAATDGVVLAVQGV